MSPRSSRTGSGRVDEDWMRCCGVVSLVWRRAGKHRWRWRDPSLPFLCSLFPPIWLFGLVFAF
uniref:Uncharacterized protein n=2 Tax=Cercopithecidae TaxID=9527 RepID=Q9MZZ1_MACFA|nr:hypothetical protein [Macaca fascicularis]